MRHRLAGRKLGRTTSHRWALFRNMAHSLVEKGRIETTLNKARELRPFADHLVTLGKRGDLSARRQAFWFVRSESTVKKLFSEVAPLFQNRNGGYTRVLKLGFRLGDSAPMALIEYVSFPETQKKAPPTQDKKAKKAASDTARPAKKEKGALKEKAAKKETKKAPSKKKEEKSSKKEEKEVKKASKKVAQK